MHIAGEPEFNPRTTRTTLEMAKKSQDYTDFMKDVMGAFPVDTKAFEDVFKSSASLNEKLSAVALDAAEKSAGVLRRLKSTGVT